MFRKCIMNWINFPANHSLKQGHRQRLLKGRATWFNCDFREYQLRIVGKNEIFKYLLKNKKDLKN